MGATPVASIKHDRVTKYTLADCSQSIEDFEKEQDALDDCRTSQTSTIGVLPSKRRKHHIPNVAALSLEVKALAELGETNWVGLLAEFRAAHPTPDDHGLLYTESLIRASESSAPPRFAFTVEIFEHPTPIDFPYNLAFTRKKDAKQYASKLAIDLLIAKKLMPSDGSVRFPKPQQTCSPSIVSSRLSESTTTFASQVPGMCRKLGFSTPTYVIEPVTLGSSVYNGYAQFLEDPRVDANVGVFGGVFGRKHAKEICAEGVLNFLNEVESHRVESLVRKDEAAKGMITTG